VKESTSLRNQFQGAGQLPCSLKRLCRKSNERTDAVALKMRTPKTCGPYCWQEKGALRLIAKYFGEGEQLASARSVYLALTEIASDEQSDRFQKCVLYISIRAGLGKRTVGPILSKLAQIGVIKRDRVFDGKQELESRYQLLQLEVRQSKQKQRPPAQPLHDPSEITARPPCNLPPPLVADLKKESKEEEEEAEEKTPSGKLSFAEETRRLL
jgi:hypothetical protein